MTRRPFRKFVKDFMLVAGIGLACLGTFNIVIDPHRTFNFRNTPALDACKTARGGRIAKAEQLRHGPWDIVILGNSRVDAGIDPANPAWPSRRVFNCGLTGLNFIEEAKVFEFLETVTHPNTVVVCVDFFHFQDGAAVADEFHFSRFNLERSAPAHYLDALWGATPTWHSILTLSNYFGGKSHDYSDLGLRIKPMAPPDRSGRSAFEAYVGHAIETWHHQGAWPGNQQCFKRFEEMLRLAADRRTRLIVVMLPVHALDLEMIRCQLGDPAPIQDWKRGLFAALAAFRRDRPGAKAVPLWDFTGYRGYPADPVPPRGDPHPMTWYWEPSHFRKELGDLLICRILNQPAPDGRDITDFGALLDETNIEAHLSRLQADREQFARQFAGEIELIETRVRAAGKR